MARPSTPHGISEIRRTGARACSCVEISLDDDVFQCMIRADLHRLKNLGAKTRSHREIASQSNSIGMEDQVTQAMKKGNSRGLCGRGALLDLLLKQVVEVTQKVLNDIDDGATKISSHVHTLVGPFVDALERLHLFQDTSRTPSKGRNLLSPAVGPLVSKPRTREMVVQTDCSEASKSVPASQVKPLPKPSVACVPRNGLEHITAKRPVKDNSTQVEKVSRTSSSIQTSSGEFQFDASVQVNFSSDTISSRADACVQAFDEVRSLPEFRNIGTQTSPRDSPFSSSAVQTDSQNSGQQNSAIRTVRITRMQRLTSQSQPVLPCSSSAHASEVDSNNDSIDGAQNRSSRRMDTHAGASQRAPENIKKTRSCSETRKHGKVAAANHTYSFARNEQEKSVSSLLRCPAGHGLQLIRSCSQSKENALSCDSCASVIGNSETFHGCAVCFQDSGERRAICGTCSRRRLPHASALEKSLSLNKLPRTYASEWSTVSSMLPALSTGTNALAVTCSALNEAVARLGDRVDILSPCSAIGK